MVAQYSILSSSDLTSWFRVYLKGFASTPVRNTINQMKDTPYEHTPYYNLINITGLTEEMTILHKFLNPSFTEIQQIMELMCSIVDLTISKFLSRKSCKYTLPKDIH